MAHKKPTPTIKLLTNYTEFVKFKFPDAKVPEVKKIVALLHLLDNGYDTHFVYDDSISISSIMVRDLGLDDYTFYKWLDNNRFFNAGAFGYEYRNPIDVNAEKRRIKIVNERLAKEGMQLKEEPKDVLGSYSRPFKPSNELIDIHREAVKFINDAYLNATDENPVYGMVINEGRKALYPSDEFRIVHCIKYQLNDLQVNYLNAIKDKIEKKHEGGFVEDDDWDKIRHVNRVLTALNDDNQLITGFRRGETRRMIETPMITQSMPKTVRKSLYHGHWDYDIRSCHFTLLVNLIDAYYDVIMTTKGNESYTGDFETVRSCSKEPKKVRTKVAKETGCTYEQAKEILIAVMYGSSLSATIDQVEYGFVPDVLKGMDFEMIERIKASSVLIDLVKELEVIYRWVDAPYWMINDDGIKRLKVEGRYISYDWMYQTDSEYRSNELSKWTEIFASANRRQPTRKEKQEFIQKLIDVGTRDQEGRTLKKRVRRIGYSIKDPIYNKIQSMKKPKLKLSYFLQMIESFILDLIIQTYQPIGCFHDGWVLDKKVEVEEIRKLIESELGLKVVVESTMFKSIVSSLRSTQS